MSSGNEQSVPAAGAAPEPTSEKPEDAFKPVSAPTEVTAESSTVAADVVEKDSEEGNHKPVNGADDEDKPNGEAIEAVASTDKAVDTAEAATNKKKEPTKRRSSGVPEHNKGKKSKGGKPPPQLILDAKPGDYYWAHLKGHPAWPAIIADEEMLPERIIVQRPVTAMRPDGSYREDYEEGGKNVKDRTYAVMYLGTYEFSWTKNTDLKPLDPSTIDLEPQGKKSKMLWKAYEEAKEAHPLQHWKDLLAEVQAAIEQTAAAAAEAQAEAEEKAKAKVAKTAKGKRKSKGGADEDVDMLDVAEETPESKATKPSKKRKKAESAEGDEEKPAKTPKTTSGVKLSLKATPNGGTSSASKKGKTASATKKSGKKDKAVELTPEEALKARHEQVLWLRHKLQKGFLTRDQIPQEGEMDLMANYIGALETAGTIEASIIRETRIAKVLRGILRLDNIPLEEKHNFKPRCQKLLEGMNKILDSDTTEPAGEASKGKGTSDDVKPLAPAEEAKVGSSLAAAAIERKADAIAKESDMDAAAEKKETGEKAQGDKQAEPAKDPKDEKPVEEKKDEPMPDADADADASAKGDSKEVKESVEAAAEPAEEKESTADAAAAGDDKPTETS